MKQKQLITSGRAMEFIGKLSKLCNKYGIVIVHDKNYDKPVLKESDNTPFSRSKLTYMFSYFEPVPNEEPPRPIGFIEHIYLEKFTKEEYIKKHGEWPPLETK